MHELLNQLFGHLAGMWRFRWQAMLFAWLVCLGGWGLVYTLPDVYQSSTRVYVDTESFITKVLGKAVLPDNSVNERLRLMATALLSRPNLERVARETDMDHRASTPAEMEALLLQLGERIQLTQGRRESLFSITYTDYDAKLAQKVVQRLLEVFMEDTLGQPIKKSEEAQTFVEEQVREYEQKLIDVEQRLEDFKRKNVGLMPGDQGDYYERLTNAMAEKERAEAALRLARRKREELMSQLEGERPVFLNPDGGTSTGAGSSYDATISQYEAQLSELLLTYTEQHPQVKNLRELIEELKKRRDAELEQIGQSTGESSFSSPLDLNPVYQQMRINLSQTEVEIAGLTAQVREQETQIEKLRQMVNTIPEVERQMGAITREYAATKAMYENLLGRREVGDLSKEARIHEQVDFQIIDPPTEALKPSGPNRPLYLAAVLGFAVCAGLAMAFLLHQLRPVFFTRKALHDAIGLPVLGAISRIRTTQQAMAARIETLSYGGACVMLLLFFGGAVAFQSYGTKLVQSWLG